MKKIISIFFVLILFTSCGNNIERKAKSQFKKTIEWIDKETGNETKIKDFSLYYKGPSDSIAIYKYELANNGDIIDYGYYIYRILEDRDWEVFDDRDFVEKARKSAKSFSSLIGDNSDDEKFLEMNINLLISANEYDGSIFGRYIE